MTLEAWANNIVGSNVPFEPKGRSRNGIDCWGLIWLAYKEVYELEIPSYDEEYKEQDVKDLNKLADLMEKYEEIWDPVEHARPGDCIALKLFGRPIHVGIVISPGLMLHIERDINVCIESYGGIHWKNRIYGFFRHKSRSANPSF